MHTFPHRLIWLKVHIALETETDNFGDVRPSQLLTLVTKKLSRTQQI